MRQRRPGFALLLTLVVAACRGGGDENLGVAGREAAIDVARLAGPGALEKALGASSSSVEQKLGAHRRVQTARLSLTGGERKETFEETWRTEVDGSGGVHASHGGGRGPGIEWYAVDGALYTKLDYGRFTRRDPQGDEVERIRDEQSGVLASYLSLLGRFTACRDAGAVDVAGRPARKVALSLEPSPRAFTDEQPDHAWRKGVHVTALTGEVTVDAASGAPLAATLEAGYTFRRGEREITVILAYKSETTVGAVAKLAAPADAQPSPARLRPLLDRGALLDGLVANPGPR